MASTNARKSMSTSSQRKKMYAKLPPNEAAKKLIRMKEVARATRKSERRRTLLERKGNNGETD